MNNKYNPGEDTKSEITNIIPMNDGILLKYLKRAGNIAPTVKKKNILEKRKEKNRYMASVLD